MCKSVITINFLLVNLKIAFIITVLIKQIKKLRMKIIPVILSGGSGTRLWPLSRSAYPKQLLPLVFEKTMLQETLFRLNDWGNIEPPIIVCGNDHRFIVAEQLRDIGIDPRVIILEPEGRNTAPAIAAASILLNSDSDSVMLILPADHVIRDVQAFERIVMTAIDHAKNNKLVTFGIAPSSADTGYGYIQLGKGISGSENSFEIKRFVEKPDLQTAKDYLQSGEYFWNSGMFLFKSKIFIEELLRYEPKMVNQVQLAIDNSYNDLDFLRLSEKEFKECPSNSIDYAVMEKTELGVIVRTKIGWSDIGSWGPCHQSQLKIKMEILFEVIHSLSTPKIHSFDLSVDSLQQ